jgi:hypothetical protein
MLALAFNPDKISRSTTRAQWAEIHRWKRVVEKKLQAETLRQIENLSIYGSTHPELAMRIADRIVDPPMMIYP